MPPGAVLKGPALSVASPLMRTVSAPAADDSAAVNCTFAAKICESLGIWTSGKRKPMKRAFWKSSPGLLRTIVPLACCSASSALAEIRSERWRSPGPQLQAHVYAFESTGAIAPPWKPHPVVSAMTATSTAHTLMVAVVPRGKCGERAGWVVADEGPLTTKVPRRCRGYIDNH